MTRFIALLILLIAGTSAASAAPSEATCWNNLDDPLCAAWLQARIAAVQKRDDQERTDRYRREAPRTKRLMADLRECVQARTKELASGPDNAYLVGIAAVSLCDDELQAAVSSNVIKRGIVSWSDAYADALQKVTNQAMALVVLERAKN